MKNLILFSFLIALISTTSSAQKKVAFGVKGGVNLATISSASSSHSSSKAAMYIGAITEFSIGNKFSIQPEIMYARHRFDVRPDVNGGIAQPREYTLDYIQIPVLAKYYLNKNIALEFGPSFNILLKDKLIYPSNNSLNMSGFANKTELSGIIGASYSLNSVFFANLRYSKGISELTPNGKTNSFQIGIGYLFQ